MTVRVTLWNEFWHERHNPEVQKVYPEGIHEVLAPALRGHGLEVRTATLEEPEHGLDEAALAATDVLVWWGHKQHDAVADAVVERVAARVHAGMGLVVLHSGHFSKIFRRLMGTPCTVNWRVATDTERMWVVKPEHPICAGLGRYLEIPREEMYGEVFEVPEPEEVLMISWFTGGEVFRSALTWTRGRGRVFYFRPGHETYPTYRNALVQRVIAQGCRWAAPSGPVGAPPQNQRREPIERLP
jgi:trehalose utilization protein